MVRHFSLYARGNGSRRDVPGRSFPKDSMVLVDPIKRATAIIKDLSVSHEIREHLEKLLGEYREKADKVGRIAANDIYKQIQAVLNDPLRIEQDVNATVKAMVEPLSEIAAENLKDDTSNKLSADNINAAQRMMNVFPTAEAPIDVGGEQWECCKFADSEEVLIRTSSGQSYCFTTKNLDSPIKVYHLPDQTWLEINQTDFNILCQAYEALTTPSELPVGSDLQSEPSV